MKVAQTERGNTRGEETKSRPYFTHFLTQKYTPLSTSQVYAVGLTDFGTFDTTETPFVSPIRRKRRRRREERGIAAIEGHRDGASQVRVNGDEALR